MAGGDMFIDHIDADIVARRNVPAESADRGVRLSQPHHCALLPGAVAGCETDSPRMGRKRHADARELTIAADRGGSNGARVRLWKIELQRFADETGLALNVHHYPPGTSRWNRIEHDLFCHITQTWRGRPLTDRMAVVELIAATTTKAGLKIESALDTRAYEKGTKVSDAQMKALDRSILNGTTPSAPEQLTIAAVNVADVLSDAWRLIARGRGRTSASDSTPWSRGSTRRAPCRGRARKTDGIRAPI